MSTTEARSNDDGGVASAGTIDMKLEVVVIPGEHEKRIGQADENWPDWYAAYMVAERSGAELPT
jgi:hypothetical protein